MGLFDKISSQFIDIIEWLDESNNTLVYRVPTYQQEIKMGAQLTVRDGECFQRLPHNKPSPESGSVPRKRNAPR